MAFKTIMIKGDGVRIEKLAVAAITPGHLVEITSADKLQKHSNAGQPAAPIFAVEDELQGKEIGDDYAADAQVQAQVCRPGDEVYALIKDGETIAIGDFLESDGAGRLQKYTADSAGAVEYPRSIVAVALEAVDMSDSSAADPSGRCRVLVI